MVKKINVKLWLFKWVIITLAIVINGLALLSWVDLFLFGQPKNFYEWAILTSNTAIGWVMIHVCYVNWDLNIYDHFMDKRD